MAVMQFGSRHGTVTLGGSSGRIQGIEQALRYVRNVTARHEQIAEQMIVAEALKIFNESQFLCPIDKGLLRASGDIVVKGKGFKTVVYIIYGMYYAIYVHEDPIAHHDPPTSWKYVEIPMRKYGPGVVGRIRKEFQRRQ